MNGIRTSIVLRLPQLVAVAALVSGCATMIDEHTAPPADWPALTIDTRVVSVLEVQRRCGRYMGTAARILSLGLVGACAEIHFKEKVCVIWMPSGENDPGIYQHELDHCAGRDHPGESTLRDAWQAFKAAK